MFAQVNSSLEIFAKEELEYFPASYFKGANKNETEIKLIGSKTY
jgi:hypothetical protein